MELVNIQYSGEGQRSQDLSQKDKRLVTSNFINSAFGAENDYLELYVYGETGNLLQADYDAFDYYPFLTNNPKNNTYSNLLLDPEKDLKNRGFNRGNLNIQYNFYKRLFNSALGRFYWIKEISTSRTEIKLASQTLSDISIREGFNAYQSYIATKNYYPVFYLNFGNNQTVIANNVAYTEDEDGGYLLIKLYEPLPTQYDLKTELWIVDKVAESVSFNVSIDIQAENLEEINRLRGPNYNVVLNTKNGQTTPYYNYNNLLTSELSSSYQKLRSYYQDKAIQINVDYSDFSNFVHFSSAVERVNNFVYKIQLIESASAVIAEQQSISGNSTYINSTVTAEQQTINNLIKNFDTYEYYLYFESASWAWPKSATTQPYSLYSVTSSQVSNFLGGINTIPTSTTQSLLWSASYYDSTNKDLLHNSIPQYILDDPSNQPYVTFLDMIGQHFDNIWIYYKDVTNRFNATNNPNTGISLDLVSDALRGLGFNLYTNSNVSDNLYYTLFGINPDGSLLPPTGSEIITNYVTSSLTTLPAETIQNELYKRVYHNLPYLLKSKGTARGVKALISTFGIPDDILTVREFGGNFTGSVDGIIDLNTSNYKVSIVTGSGGNVTGSLTLSSSLLSPYTTIQYYQGNTRLNSTNVEVGFSPADVINTNITASQGLFNLNQLIGSPGYRYSSSYAPLVSASNAYFASYTQSNSIWEYIRLLKFYNNTLFKTIKDFVPARANLSTGIIVKSHLYERNKYAQHEPVVTFHDYSQSIDIGSITGSSGGAISGSTAWNAIIVTPLGTVPFSSSTGVEKFNGELGGSGIVVTNGLAFPQYPISDEFTFFATQNGTYVISQNGSYLSTSNDPTEIQQIVSALYQNISGSVRSLVLLDLDYNSNQLKPVNYGAVTYSISQSQINNYNTYTNPNNPYAYVQDYNYNLKRSIIPRYSGSKTFSATYNEYTIGDQSYGKTAAIDKIKYQYAYIVDIYSSSFQLPYRAQGQIKYLIDNDQNVINLSKINNNLFTVQNIFKAGEWVDVSLFNYDQSNPYVQRLNNEDKDFTIWESGYSYTPVLYNIGGSGSLNFNLLTPSSSTSTTNIPSYTTLNPGNTNYWTINSPITAFQAPVTPSTPGRFGITGSSYVTSNTLAVLVNFTITNTLKGGTFTGQFTIPASQTAPYKVDFYTSPNATPYNTWLVSDGLTISTTQQSYNPSGGSTTLTTYVTSLVDNDPYLIVENDTSILLSATQSLNYGNIILNATQSGLDIPVFPLELKPMDLIRLYNTASAWSSQNSEYRIKEIIEYNTSSIDYIKLVLNRSLNPADISGSAIPGRIYKYIILKRLEDETAVTFNYDLPKPIPNDGLLFPQYIGDGVKEGSGNVIKALKQQNLLPNTILGSSDGSSPTILGI